MTIDYGVRRKARERLPLAAIIAALALGGAIAVAFELHEMGLKKAANIAEAAQWDVDGPACPELTASQFLARGLKAPQVFDYGDLTISRRVGHVMCGAAAKDPRRSLASRPVCEFTGPDVLRVKTRKGEWFYQPGVGQPASIIVEHDMPRCVMASHFTLQG